MNFLRPSGFYELTHNLWVVLSGKELPPKGEPYKDRFLLVPLAASTSQLDSAVDAVIQEVTAAS